MNYSQRGKMYAARREQSVHFPSLPVPVIPVTKSTVLLTVGGRAWNGETKKFLMKSLDLDGKSL